jgi:hypothetical protein
VPRGCRRRHGRRRAGGRGFLCVEWGRRTMMNAWLFS